MFLKPQHILGHQVLLAPIIAKLLALAKHASEAQGPVLSIINFFQSSDLFQGLKLRWPPEFRTFCRVVASFFSFNISELLSKINDFIHHFFKIHMPAWMKDLIPHVPPPACALHLPYERKWMLSMASPVAVVLIVGALILLRTLGSATLDVLTRFSPCCARRLCQVWRCSCCCRRSKRDASVEETVISTTADDSEPSLPNEYLTNPRLSQQRSACPSLRQFLRSISKSVLV